MGLSAHGLSDETQDRLTVWADDLIQAFRFSYALMQFSDGQTSRTEVAIKRAVCEAVSYTHLTAADE